jgi:hypothetical protein
MSIATFVIYFCDREACGKHVEGRSDRPPKGWGQTRWVPGILKPWGVPEGLQEAKVFHYCSKACFDADAPARKKHEDRVHGAYDQALDQALERGA